MITTPTIMYLGFAMHKIARMDDSEYRPLRNQKKKMPIVNRGAVRDYEEAEDNGEEDPMIAEEIEQDKPEKTEKGKAEVELVRPPRSKNQALTGVSLLFFQVRRRSTMVAGGSSATA